MPTPVIAEEAVRTNAVTPAGARILDKHGPVDILFHKLSPSVLAAMDSSAFLAKKALGDAKSGDSSTLVSVVIQKLQSVLDLLVLVRLISKGSRDWFITTIVESSALLPAATTLLMPGYFTEFGVIYVSLVVPAGYSTAACEAVRKCGGSRRLVTRMPYMDEASRYLQFWLVHAAISLLLGSLAAPLAWLPFSTHATWLLWAYVQLNSTTRRIYVGFVRELEHESLEDSMLVRSGRRILAALPTNVDDSVTQRPTRNTQDVVVTNGEKSKVAGKQGPGGDAKDTVAADGGKSKVTQEESSGSEDAEN